MYFTGTRHFALSTVTGSVSARVSERRARETET